MRHHYARVKRLRLRNIVLPFVLAWLLVTVLILAQSPSASSSGSQKASHPPAGARSPSSTFSACPRALDLRRALHSTVPMFGASHLEVWRKIETKQTSAWWSTPEGGGEPGARVLVLGQQGYVKRDLPVYKAAFESIHFTLLPRPASGKIDAAAVSSPAEFDSLLCLSFNTDHCLDSDENFEDIGRGRKINRLLNLRDVIWSKHKFCETMSTALGNLPDRELSGATFPCWVMPDQYDKMLKDSEREDISRWISKPRSLGAGIGITIVDNLEELAKERHSSHVVQAYMTDPHLVKALDAGLHKWDARTYVLVTSAVPLRAYVYSRGLVRLATSPYSSDCKSHNQTACLTNTSINKKAEGASSHKLKDITWSFHHLEKYFAEDGGGDYAAMFSRMQLAIGTVLLSAEAQFVKSWDGALKCANCYQLLGVDVIFDAGGRPKIVEVNGEPSMRLTAGASTHYDTTKKNMARDLVGLVFNKQSGLDALAPLFPKVSAVCAEGKPFVSDRDAGYLLDMFRESRRLGDFKHVYPHAALHAKHRVLLEYFARTRLGFHADGLRLKTHDLIGLLLGVPDGRRSSGAAAGGQDDDGEDDEDD